MGYGLGRGSGTHSENGADSGTPAAEIGILHPQVLLLTAGTTTSLFLGFRFYRRYIVRIRTYLDLTSAIIDHQRPLYGRVTRVGDGDNFRFYHTPGGVWCGWGWLRKVPSSVKELKDETLMIRLCGVDAPERSHWGKPSQPYSEEALEWLKLYLLGRNVTVTPYLIDQYKRVVARAQVWKLTGKKDVSAEMLKGGWGIVYESNTGAEFGDNETWYRNLEARAKKLKKGVWGLKKMTTPGDFKRLNYRGQ